ncbi:hypothetical protein NP493_141g04003 [Ridgeia piscesae]|uniref:Uncharacterized protein n=1 Tax=Ridgeia piscesae TaxID=27915 RepID=A0AAD9UG21_RIDPI|nr:hypothetical protein NP493_141g04003 [Ridgeia piscesae]
MFQGWMVLKTGNLELASYCVRHAADLNAALGGSPTQQAIVQTFLKNYSKAIEALQTAIASKRSASLFTLLGKIQMKASLWKDAVTSFESSLDIMVSTNTVTMKPWDDKQQWPPEAAEMFYLIGTCHTEMRNYLDAHDAFNSAIRVEPKHAEAYYQRGLAKLRLKQSKGIQDFNKALSLDPALFQAYLSRATYYGLKRRYTKAILNCNEAIKLQPKSIRSFLYRGALKFHIRSYTLAIRDLSTAINLDNTCAVAYFNRAVCYHSNGHWQKALQDYGIVLLLGDMLMLKVLINRGLLYFERRDYRNALYDLLLASQISPTEKSIHHTVGLCYHKLRRLEKAVESFSTSLKLDPFFTDAYISRGNVYMDYGHSRGLTEAKHDYQRVLHMDPLNVRARVNLALGLQVSSKFQQAWDQFSIAISVDPQFQPALEGRAIINLQMSDTFAAFHDISTSLAVQATAELYTNRGVINQFMGDLVNAMKDYQLAIKSDTTYSLAYFNAANVYFHTRRFEQAKVYYHTALQYNPRDESAYLNSAITKVMLKDANGALADFEKAIALSPHSAHIYLNRGNLFAALNQWDKAEADYTMALSKQPDDPLVLKRRAEVRGKMGRKAQAISDYKYAISIQTSRTVYESAGGDMA